MSNIINQISEFILDPEGEITLILHNPNASFAVWDLTPASNYHDPRGRTKFDWTPKTPTDPVLIRSIPITQAVANKLATEARAAAHVSSETGLFENRTEDGHEDGQPGQLERDIAEGPEQEASMEESSSSEPAPVRFRVSAKHLALASPVFQRMLGKSGWKEARQLQEQGSLKVDAYDFDTEALLVFLRIIHCRVTQLPQKIGLELMAKLAVIADYYECRDLVAYYVKPIILGNHYNTQPKRYTRNLVLWVWVAYFFDLPELFRQVTETAMQEAGGLITSLGLPIPKQIIDDMNQGRVEGIQKILDALHSAKQTLLTPPFKCSSECDSMLLGSLMMQMSVHGLLDPKPEAPFLGLRHRKLVKDVVDFWCPEGPNLRHTKHFGWSASPEYHAACEFQNLSWHFGSMAAPKFDEYLKHWEWEVGGLGLIDYVSR